MTKLLIVGAGLAGLSAAYHFSRVNKKDAEAVVLEKSGQSCSLKAQGGIACALGEGDSPSLHEQDTINAGAGLCEKEAVKILVQEGKKRIEELIGLGASFDEEGGRLSFGLEAAHSRKRIIHSHGDETGKHIAHFLRKLALEENVCFEKGFLTDFAIEGGRCSGAIIAREGETFFSQCDACIVASGGYASIFSKTSNPHSSTGDGVAAAYRAGAVLTDLEFVQFHPTVIEGSNKLVSEAVRGEGAVLVNDLGEHFLEKTPGKELAARDVVAREIFRQLSFGRKVFLDATPVKNFESRFPSITKECLKKKIDPSNGTIPIEPAAHYCMGGIRTNADSETSILGLLACGEAACTYVHGANRLASNSLLEAIVFGYRAAETASKIKKTAMCTHHHKPALQHAPPSLHSTALRQIKDLLWAHAGIVRNERGLLEAKNALERLKHAGNEQTKQKYSELLALDAECSNALAIGLLILEASLMRQESRGSHHRSDFPASSEEFRKHFNLSRT